MELRNQYEDEIILAIIRGYFTKSVNDRKSEDLVNQNNIEKFKRLVKVYEEGRKNNKEKEKYYNNILRLLYFSKETVYSASN